MEREGRRRRDMRVHHLHVHYALFFWVDILLSLFFASRENEQQGSEGRAHSGKQERGEMKPRKEGRKERKNRGRKKDACLLSLSTFFFFFFFLSFKCIKQAKQQPEGQTKKGEGHYSLTFFWDKQESVYVAWAPGKWCLV
ncbi:hypothetical protein BKA57DRAFT_82129 [Linnemannia elongata]|nr:hypothetical protein BKA57DRAFT_82129 [Linnemannia elongata]